MGGSDVVVGTASHADCRIPAGRGRFCPDCGERLERTPRRARIAAAAATAVLGLLVAAGVGAGRAPADAQTGLAELLSAGDVSVAQSPDDQFPSFLQGELPLAALGVTGADLLDPAQAQSLAGRVAPALGLADPADLEVVDSHVDAEGVQHATLQQVHDGVPVRDAQVGLHVDVAADAIVAISNGYVPGVEVDVTAVGITADEAAALGAAAVPGGVVATPPELAIHVDRNVPVRSLAAGDSARLAWHVEMVDDSRALRNVYVLDAADGSLIDVVPMATDARDRLTYDAANQRALPGILSRSEGDPAVGDPDVDGAHDEAGRTYDYFANTHGRDSFDGAGAPMLTTANFGRNYPNAFWNGTRTVYGDDFATRDIVAHEWTHALTEFTASLVYEWQSGALNESYSDVFGVMVDRDDWLLGEDLPADLLGGRPAIRDLETPTRLGQPGHTDNWVKTCSDNEGVHINSGITNKAFYNAATALDKERAERIFFRALTVYLGPRATLNDARLASIQSAEDLFGQGPERQAVIDAFNAVGLDGNWSPDSNDCSCGATALLTDATLFDDPLQAITYATTLYRVRDELLGVHPTGGYYERLFYDHTGRIAELLVSDRDLRHRSAGILTSLVPNLDAMLDGTGDAVTVDAGLVGEFEALMADFAAADRAAGGGDLAATIERELGRLDLGELTGLSYDDAWLRVQSRGAGPVEASATESVGPYPLARMGGAGGDDERASDTHVAIAFDAVTNRFLTVWASARNASSSRSGLDVFGRFLDRHGTPLGPEFRISDSNNVARNGPPAVAAGHGEFVVAWTNRGSSCLVAGQRVSSEGNPPDFLVARAATHAHSPSIAFDPASGRFVVAYVVGDDYLPPRLFGADTDDCGDNPASSSQINTISMQLKRTNTNISSPTRLGAAQGAFRPQVAADQHGGLMVVWEDRRAASGDASQFEVRGHRVRSNATALGSEVLVSVGSSYDTESHWTPRPALAGGAGPGEYLVSWYRRLPASQGLDIWRLLARPVVNGAAQPRVALAEMSYWEAHPDEPPTGFVSVAYHPGLDDYLVAQTVHLESLWGYFPFALASRVTPDGDVLRLDGKPRQRLGVGEALDYTIDAQVFVDVAVNPRSQRATDAVFAFGKHSPESEEKDFDIWYSDTEFGARSAGPPISDVGLVDPAQGRWYLHNADGKTTAFYYGNPGDFPIMGDWDCNGTETAGMYRQSDGFVYLRNRNSAGVADTRFFFGNPGDVPIVGDFNGDGCDTVSIYRPSQGQVFIINELGRNDGGLGAADFSYFFGNPGDKPFVGDFDGDGKETVGLHRESTGLVYFNNEHRSRNADSTFLFGDPGDRLVAGDWIGDARDTPAIFRPAAARFYFRFTNSQGTADSSLGLGASAWLPVAGDFGLS